MNKFFKIYFFLLQLILYTKVKVIDAYEVQDCELPQNQTVKEVKIQLVQEVDSFQRTVHICEVEKFRFVYYCGAYKHMSGAKFPEWGKYEITPMQCQIRHERRTFVVEGHTILIFGTLENIEL